jgi:hypothetical protein
MRVIRSDFRLSGYNSSGVVVIAAEFKLSSSVAMFADQLNPHILAA